MNIKTLCLAVLSLGKASGYDIGKRLEEPFGHFVDVARSGVYPVLKILEEEGLVQFENVEQTALPNKKIYELTCKGRGFLKAELEVLPPTHKIRSQFMLLVFFAEMLSQKRLETIFKERIEEMECFLQEEPYWQKMVEGNKGQEFLLEYVQAKAIFEKEFLEKNSGKLMDSLSTEVMEQEFENSYE
jgi:PadR family transcriptional regulator, regulatory protein AphA